MERSRRHDIHDHVRPATSVRVNRVHRGGAAALGVFLWVFGILGFVHRLSFFSSSGRVFDLANNGALSTISLVVGAALLASAARGGRTASTVTASIGVLFLLSGFVHLAVIDTSLNVLSFRLSNIFFSLAVGIVLLVVGAYGRLAGNKPYDSPYRRVRDADGESPAIEDVAELADAEEAVGAGTATPEQRQKVRAEIAEWQRRQYEQAWEHFARDHSEAAIAAMRMLEQRESAHSSDARRGSI